MPIPTTIKIKSIDLKEGIQYWVKENPCILIAVNGQILLNEPGGLTILNDKVLVADTNNNRIVSYDLSTKQAEILTLKE